MAVRIKRFICLLLTAALLAVGLSVAFAATTKRRGKKFKDIDGILKYVYTYCLKVYDTPSTDGPVKENVGFAKPIMVLKESKGWARVYTTNHLYGYCNASLLTTKNPNTMNTTVYSMQNSTPVYLWPSVYAPLITTLKRDEDVHLVAMTPLGDWLRVERKGYYGYIQKPRMDYNHFTQGRPAWCMSESLKIFYDPDLDTELTTMYFGQEVTLVSKDGSWAKVRSPSNLIGYCDIGGLTTVNPNTLNYTVYTQAEGNFMFTSSTDLSGRRQVDANVPMMLLAVDANQFWARIKYENEIYYMPYIFLGTEQRNGDYKKITARTGLNIREGTKRSSAIVATVPTGTEMWLIGATDNRAKVTTLPDYEGKTYTGFVELQYLK